MSNEQISGAGRANGGQEEQNIGQEEQNARQGEQNVEQGNKSGTGVKFPSLTLWKISPHFQVQQQNEKKMGWGFMIMSFITHSWIQTFLCGCNHLEVEGFSGNIPYMFLIKKLWEPIHELAFQVLPSPLSWMWMIWVISIWWVGQLNWWYWFGWSTWANDLLNWYLGHGESFLMPYQGAGATSTAGNGRDAIQDGGRKRKLPLHLDRASETLPILLLF